MELHEPIDKINYFLEKEYGLAFNSQPNFRVVFSEDQYEKRWTDKTDDGFDLLYPEVRLLPKYKQYIHEKYILERLVPVTGDTDLTTEVSYEPAWVFQDKNGNALPPWLDGCKYIIEALLTAAGHSGGHAKYIDPTSTPEGRKTQLEAVERELFGNENDTTDALAYGSGISMSGTLPDLENMKTVVSDEKESTKPETVN